MSILVSTGGFGAAGGFGVFAGGTTGFAPFLAAPLTTGLAGGTIGLAVGLPPLTGAGGGVVGRAVVLATGRVGTGLAVGRIGTGLASGFFAVGFAAGTGFLVVLATDGAERGFTSYSLFIVTQRGSRLRRAVAQLLTVDHFRRNGRKGMLTSVL